MTWVVTVYGAPRTKKTHNVLTQAGRGGRGRNILLPSPQWRAWVRGARIERGAGWKTWSPLTADVNCRARFYRDARRGDAVGFYQGLADLLEHRGILANDRQIVSWDGSRLLIDRANPRVELVLELIPVEACV